ncbi:MAG: glycosyltransferase family 4 protein [Chloroflexi bacterium]|uniref:glycosyltransferase family 4 protein n=1 Tax=Candidatus Flexifilum breve TaxID=3140694 RepID=UPI0031357BEE|nr:glycosyltransferase family 4 protein [Chloroflexota bacterium]
MRLAIDASRTTVARVTGTERYALEIIRAVLRHNTAHQITLYFRDQPPADLFPGADCRVIPYPRAWTHLRLAAELFKDRPDALWTPAHTLPFVFPGKGIMTVHDLGYKYFPEAHTPNQRRYLDLSTRWSASRARVIFADSRATANDLQRFYRTSPGKIRVVYPGVDAPPIRDVTAARKKYHLPERYFLFLGTLQPRKNIQRIVQAFQQWRKTRPKDDPTGLVLAGNPGWLFDAAWIVGAEHIYMPGFVDDADKGALYAGALGLVFPTLYEGFGFPILEAMLCGTPVIASTTSSLPELAGDAALLVDPLDVMAIADALERLSTDDALRARLIAAGRPQAQQFTWDRAAQAVLNALEDV